MKPRGDEVTSGLNWLLLSGLLLLMLLTPTAQCVGLEEVWSKRFMPNSNTNDSAAAIEVDASGNVYVVGAAIYTNSNSQLVVVKYDPTGQALWTNRFLGTQDVSAGASIIKLDTTGNIIVAGRAAQTNGLSVALLLKLDPSGNSLWSAYYIDNSTNTFLNDAAVDPSGDIVVVGNSIGASYPGGVVNSFVAKYSSSGGQVWLSQQTITNPIISSGYSSASGVLIDHATNVIVRYGSYPMESKDDLGQSYSFGAAAFFKYSPEGVLLWVTNVHCFSGSHSYPQAAAIDNSNNIAFSGYTYAGSFLMFAGKISSTGQRLWDYFRTSGGNGRSLAIDSTGNIFLSRAVNGFGTTDMAVVKFSTAGEELWRTRFLEGSFGGGYSIGLDTQGNIFALGSIYVNDDGICAAVQTGLRTAITIVKLDSNGAIVGSLQHPECGTLLGCQKKIAADGSMYVIGSYYLNYTIDPFGPPSSEIISILFKVRSVEINGQPQILAAPISKDLESGQTNRTFEVQASGPGPLYYQWFVRSQVIANATNALLDLSSDWYPSHTGESFSVRITNSSGVVYSPEATLTRQATISSLNLINVVTNSALVPAIQIRLNGEASAYYALEASTNLVDWISISSPIVAGLGEATFGRVDMGVTNRGMRFYRVKRY